MFFASCIFVTCDASQYVQGHRRWDEPKAGAVRTARCLVLAQQSSCFDAPGAKTAECSFSVALWSTAYWEGYSTEQVSVDSMKEAGLWVKTNLWNHLWVSWYFTADDISLNVCILLVFWNTHIYVVQHRGCILKAGFWVQMQVRLQVNSEHRKNNMLDVCLNLFLKLL